MNLKIYTLNTAHHEQRKKERCDNMTNEQSRKNTAQLKALFLLTLEMSKDVDEALEMFLMALELEKFLATDDIIKVREIVADNKKTTTAQSHK